MDFRDGKKFAGTYRKIKDPGDVMTGFRTPA
jgi:hypothetical protein